MTTGSSGSSVTVDTAHANNTNNGWKDDGEEENSCRYANVDGEKVARTGLTRTGPCMKLDNKSIGPGYV